MFLWMMILLLLMILLMWFIFLFLLHVGCLRRMPTAGYDDILDDWFWYIYYRLHRLLLLDRFLQVIAACYPNWLPHVDVPVEVAAALHQSLPRHRWLPPLLRRHHHHRPKHPQSLVPIHPHQPWRFKTPQPLFPPPIAAAAVIVLPVPFVPQDKPYPNRMSVWRYQTLAPLLALRYVNGCFDQKNGLCYMPPCTRMHQ